VGTEATSFTFRNGSSNLKSEITSAHPVQIIEQQYEKKREETKRNLLSKVYGAHVPLKMQMEETILSQFQRFSGLPNSFVGLETLMGKDTTIDFADYLNVPEFYEKQVDVLSEMEKRIGDKPYSRIL